MLAFKSATGQTIYVNPNAIVAVQKYPTARHTTITTNAPVGEGHLSLMVVEEPEMVSTQWKEAMSQLG